MHSSLLLLICSRPACQYTSSPLSSINQKINHSGFVTEQSRFFAQSPAFYLSFGVVFIFGSVRTLIGRTFRYRLCRFILSCSVGGIAMALDKSGGNAQHEKFRDSLDFAATELKLGLPGIAADESREHQRICGKRSFSEAMEFRNRTIPNEDEDITSTGTHEDADKFNGPIVKEKQIALPANDPARMRPQPLPKTQIVGWPPVRKSRMIAASNSLYVKVSMDGAPFLRKVDLKMYSTYQELSSELEKMFSCLITMGKCGSLGLNDSNSTDVLNGSDYVPIYEDKDGDWMLVGDVPWHMFVDSCQRMRIMKASEATAPRAMENRKNRH